MPAIIFACFLSLLVFSGITFAQSPAGEAIRSEVILEKDKALTQELKEGQKIPVEKIIVNGLKLISEEDLEDAISPLQKNWLTKREIQQMLHSIEDVYGQKGHAGEPKGITYQVRNKVLIIKVKE